MTRIPDPWVIEEKERRQRREQDRPRPSVSYPNREPSYHRIDEVIEKIDRMPIRIHLL